MFLENCVYKEYYEQNKMKAKCSNQHIIYIFLIIETISEIFISFFSLEKYVLFIEHVCTALAISLSSSQININFSVKMLGIRMESDIMWFILKQIEALWMKNQRKRAGKRNQRRTH